MTKKIKIFLGGFVNSVQAQDLNCRALAMFLDRDKFDVSAMLVPQEFRDFDIGPELNGVELIQLNRPARILRYWTYFIGIAKCDIAYLPHLHLTRWCRFWLWLLHKKSFITVEGVISGTNLEKALKIFKTEKRIADEYNAYTRTYAITEYLGNYNNRHLKIRNDGLLYLGVDFEKFAIKRKPNYASRSLQVVFIGNNMRYKGIEDIFYLAQHFPYMRFHIVGGGLGYDVLAEVKKRHLKNVICHGQLNHDKLSDLLTDIDIHVFPSRSEGFPKVTLETAAAGVPSIVYNDYGAAEWITSGENGFVVNRVEQMAEIIHELDTNREKLSEISQNAIELARRFDWRVLIRNWENTIEEIVK